MTRPQFSLAALFGVVTGLCVSLGLLPLTIPYFWTFALWQLIGVFGICCLALAGMITFLTLRYRAKRVQP